MTQASTAIGLTKRGLSVFRIASGSKSIFIDKDWDTGGAVSAPIDAYEKFTGEKCNIGVWAAGLCIFDVDEYKPNFGGADLIASLPKTFTVRSARGGRHFYFRLPEGMAVAASRSTLEIGVDVKTNGGYVVGPGSVFEGKAYTVEVDAPVAVLPGALLERLQASAREAVAPLSVQGDLDSPASLQSAVTWLQTAAPLAVEGSGGDACTYRVANHVLDRGVSPEAALQLLAEHWNNRCSPPWDLEDLEKKINNAAQYRQAAIGRDNPEYGFTRVEAEDALDDFEREVWEWDDTEESAAAIPLTPWIVPGKILREAVTLLGAPGAAGKSLLALQWALAVATGRGDLCGGLVSEQTQCLVVNNEDPKDELRRRLNGAARHFGLDSASVKGIHLYSGHAKKFKLLLRNATGKGFTDGPALHLLKKFVLKRRIGVVIFDPLVTMHGASENNNDEMNLVMEKLTSFAAETKAAVILVHHTSKPPVASSDSYAGNVNSIRGASATKDASRIALTLYGMSENDAEKFGVPAHIKHRYVRLDDAKANLHLASPEAAWFHKTSVKLANGEERGILQPISLQPAALQDGPAMAAVLVATLRKGPLALKTAASIIAADPMFSGAGGVDSICRRFMEAFAFGSVPTDEGRVVFEKTGKVGGTVRFETYSA